MIVTVDCDFMASRFDFPDEIRKSLSDPPQDEKCCPGFMSIKKTEETIRALKHSQLTRVPIFFSYGGAQVMHAKPVFQIN
jgi:hypothetical protein